MISRRHFLSIANALGVAALLPETFTSCKAQAAITGNIVGANAALGHRLRSMDFPPVSKEIKTNTVIVGGGVSGLSAARYLHRSNHEFLLLEMSDVPGGNAVGGKNNFTKYPWGAHYLPLPNQQDPDLIEFLSEAKVITGIKNGLPVFNEYYLCHDPKERLYINNLWQEGLVPHEGVPQQERDEIQRFLELMHSFRNLRGSDGKEAFTIPLDFSSQDPEILLLDTITALEYLRKNNFVSPHLLWYIQYCCADDFGSSLEDTSAWAMIHYFASRKGQASNAASDAVLTWPEGNFWLVNQLRHGVEKNIKTNSLVYRVELHDGEVNCFCYDAAKNVSTKITSKKVIMATPQFINQRLLKGVDRDLDFNAFEYPPWMVANITTTHSLNERRGELVSWDNVIYGSNALGYVNASHQYIGIPDSQKVLTYYKPLLGRDVSMSRRSAYEKTFDDWKKEIIDDLRKPHPGIDQYISNIDVWLWGHAMTRPGRGFIWSENRLRASQSIQQQIYFAHSDLSGISIFEEAFYRGHKAARAVLNHENT